LLVAAAPQWAQSAIRHLCRRVRAILRCSACLRMNAADWTSDLTHSINRMTQNINEQVQQFTRQLQTQIHQNVEASLEPALRQASRAINNLPRGNSEICRDADSRRSEDRDRDERRLVRLSRRVGRRKRVAECKPK